MIIENDLFVLRLFLGDNANTSFIQFFSFFIIIVIHCFHSAELLTTDDN